MALLPGLLSRIEGFTSIDWEEDIKDYFDIDRLEEEGIIGIGLVVISINLEEIEQGMGYIVRGSLELEDLVRA